jgi:hypothetical protein
MRNVRRRPATSVSTLVASEADVIAQVNTRFPEPATKVVPPSASGAPSPQETT